MFVSAKFVTTTTRVELSITGSTQRDRIQSEVLIAVHLAGSRSVVSQLIVPIPPVAVLIAPSIGSPVSARHGASNLYMGS